MQVELCGRLQLVLCEARRGLDPLQEIQILQTMAEKAPLRDHHWRVGEGLRILKVKLWFQRLRWDYLIPDDTDYELEAGTQNPELKAFNWIREHGTTMKQVLILVVSDSGIHSSHRWFQCFLLLTCPHGLPLPRVSTHRTLEWSGTTCTTCRTSRCSIGTMTWPASTVGGQRGSPSGW